jgi:hypothetical protein
MTEEITPGRKAGRPRGYIENYRPQRKTVDLLNDVDLVLEEYRAHWPLTCRQIFYRLVGARGYPKTEEFYRKLCHHLANARRGLRIDFDAIRDDGVVTVRMQHFDDANDFKRHIRELGENYERNKLANQEHHVEVWCEAAGMINQLAEVAHEFSIHVYSCSGFESVSAKKDLADRICDIGKPAIILHLGDYDPSGLAIFEAVAEDVAAFVEADKPWGDVSVEYRRVALTAEQIEKYRLPTSPAKPTDSRSKTWTGETCQLEAMAPDDIAALLRAQIEDILDDDMLNVDRRLEAHERLELTRLLPAPGR